jgi:hypothetical protein
MKGPRRSIFFDEPDEAYLAAAALRRYLDGSMDAILIPTKLGPAIDIARDALRDPLVRAFIRRFSGRLEDDDAAAIAGPPDSTSSPTGVLTGQQPGS